MRICIATQGKWIQSLAQELKSHMLTGNSAHLPQLENILRAQGRHMQAKKKKKILRSFLTSFSIFLHLFITSSCQSLLPPNYTLNILITFPFTTTTLNAVSFPSGLLTSSFTFPKLHFTCGNLKNLSKISIKLYTLLTKYIAWYQDWLHNLQDQCKMKTRELLV